MDTKKWLEIEALFHAAREKPPGEWSAFLEARCGGDRDLKREVLDLLSLQEQADGFMETPALDQTIDFDTASEVIDKEDRALIGKEIGPYRLESLIASGGMGTVYLATRADESFRKKVAVKLIRGGLQNREILRRFYRERQILASLEHPHIATLLDGGTTEEGLPYLVMEYIEGESLDRYCDSRKLSVNARLRLFRQVCSAVQFAHGKLVVHRDIKPGNILVNREGAPKLLDFGIVKILDADNVQATALTLTVQRVMTPEYASPEQARGDSVTTATDIYSLGLVLYELLSGHRPFRFQTTSFQEVARIICEEEPLKPSQAVSQSVAIVTRTGESRTLTPENVSRTRGGRPDKLRRRLAGDLDQMVMKALRKEPEKRYASVEHFSEDIDRHLSGLPVLARRGTVKYRAEKFLKRHKAGFASLAMLVLVLLGWFSLNARTAQRLAMQKAADQVLDRLFQLNEKPLSRGNTREEIRQVLDAPATKQLVDDLTDQPVERNRYVNAITQACERAHLLDLSVYWRKVSLDGGYSLGGKREEARLLYGQALYRARKFAEAERQVSQAIQQAEESAGIPLMLGRLTHLLALIRMEQGDAKSPGALFEQALEHLTGAGDSQIRQRLEVTRDFARFLDDQGATGRAIRLLEEALAHTASLAPDSRPLVRAGINQTLGNLLWNSPRFYESEIYLRKALETYVRFLPEEDPRVAACMNDLAYLLLIFSKTRSDFNVSAAQTYWRTARKVREALFGQNSYAVAHSLYTVAVTCGRLDAPILLKNVLEECSGLWPETNPGLAEMRIWMGAWLPELSGHDLTEGEQLIRPALQNQLAYYPEDHPKIGLTRLFLGANLIRQRRPDEGKPLIAEGLRVLEKARGANHPLTGRLCAWLSAFLARDPEMEETARSYQAYGERFDRAWPYGWEIRDCDDTHENVVIVGFEDDLAEKVLVIDPEKDLTVLRTAYLWTYGQLSNYTWQELRKYENLCLRVNADPEQEIRVDVALKFSYITDQFQWVPIEIPIAWLKPGANLFAFFTIHEPDYAESRPWQYNNLGIGVDQDHNRDRSWWFGGTEAKGTTCCFSMSNAAWEAKKPLSRTDPIITEHRQQGYKECQGELMMLLDLH